MDGTRLLALSAFASLVAGVAGSVYALAAARISGLRRNARGRFLLWLALLVFVAASAPLTYLVGNARLADVTFERLPVTATGRDARVSGELLQPAAFMRATAAATPAPPRPLRHANGLVRLVLALWLLGAVISLVRTIAGLLALRRIVARSEPLEERATTRGNVRVRICDDFDIPVATGYLRPAILLPRALLVNESAGDVETVVLHELQHLRRYDDLTALAQTLCISLLWWNPVVYFLSRRVNAEREMACDEAVVLDTGARKSYAATLWRMALAGGDTIAPALASGFASRSDVVSRFANLLEGPPPEPLRPTRVAAALGAFAALLAASAFALPAFAFPAQPVADYSKVTLRDGATLIVGGRRPDGAAVGVAQLYSPKGKREAVFALRVPRWSATSTLLKNGDVLITGGMTPAGATSDALLYRHKCRTLIEIAPLHFARAGHTATLLADGNVVIAAGERVPGTYVWQTEIYHAMQRRFQYVADGPGEIAQSAVALGRDRVLMLNGDRGQCALIFDAARNSFKNAGHLLRAEGSTLVFKQRSGRVISLTIANS